MCDFSISCGEKNTTKQLGMFTRIGIHHGIFAARYIAITNDVRKAIINQPYELMVLNPSHWNGGVLGIPNSLQHLHAFNGDDP